MIKIVEKSSSDLEEVRSLLDKHKLKIISDTIQHDLTCIKCHILILDAYEAFCGCKYCEDCKDEYLCCGKTHCLCYTEESTDTDLPVEKIITIKPCLNEKLLLAKVMCPHQWCTCSTLLTEMSEHIRVCNKEIMIPQNECMDYVELEFEEVSIMSDDSSAETSLETEFRKDLNQLKASDKQKEIKTEEIQKELALIKSMISENEKKAKSIEKESRKRNCLYQQYKRRVLNMKRARRDNSIVATMEEYNPNKYLEEGMKDNHNIEANHCVNRGIITIPMNNKMNNKRNMCISLLTFTVDRFSERNTPNEYIDSPYFYSHHNGYKLRLSVYPRGYGNGRDTHISVMIVLCKGEYDDELPWPCKHTFDICVINQRNDEAHTTLTRKYSKMPIKYKYVFNKPTGKDNDGFGNDEFISHKKLHSVDGLIVNDAVVIRCVVHSVSSIKCE